jgi:hypothetical protein
MDKKLLSYLSTGTFIIGTVIGIYALAGIYLLKSRVPPGVCPVTSNKPLLYISVIFCVVSFVLSLFEPKHKKARDDK